MNLETQRRIDDLFGSLLISLFRLPTILLGIFLKRNHELKLKDRLVIIKLRGGGSLIIALPALLAIRRAYPQIRITLICAPEILPFAKMTGCFDDYEVISLKNMGGFIWGCLRSIWNCWRCDTVVDLEIHSKMTTLFSLFLAARNRIGFYMMWDRWKDCVTTHALFYNEASPVYENYDHLALVLGAKPLSMLEASQNMRKVLGLNEQRSESKVSNLLGEVCLVGFSSDLCTEREFTAEEWAIILKQQFSSSERNIRVHLLGGPGDVMKAVIFYSRLRSQLPEKFEIVNQVGKMKLPEVAALMDRVGFVLSIDSGLNHIARALSVKTTSYWGPTDPGRLLRPFEGLDEIVHYKKVFCSPCVHVVQIPPCHGENACMKQHLGRSYDDVLAKGWLVSRGRIRG